MLYTNAMFSHKNNNFEPQSCAVEKIIRLSGAEYDHFARNMQRDWDFIRDNVDIMHRDMDGTRHCLLVVGDDRRDGILVESQGYDYARYAAFVPNAEGLLTVGQYPALAELNKKLTELVELIAQPSFDKCTYDIQDFEDRTGIDFMHNNALLHTVLDMLGERPEVKDFEIDKNELIIHYNDVKSTEKTVEDLSDPSVTKTDMFAYGYGWDGMIPLGKDRALELFDNGHAIYRLDQNDAEGMIDIREEIEKFDGLFGVEDPARDSEAQAESIEVFIVNRERQANGENVGEWLKLPSDVDTLHGLFERIGIDRPSDGAFNITAVRVPHYYLSDYISKYDNLDELNMLASFMNDMMDFERIKFEAILTLGIADIGRGTAALINVCCDENFDAFRTIDAADFEALGRCTEEEIGDKPEGISFEEYGKLIAGAENGKFAECGYIYFRYKELLPEYNGVVPDEYKIVGGALRGLQPKTPERKAEEKPSVIKQIRDAQKTPKMPRKEKTADKKKGEPEL